MSLLIESTDFSDDSISDPTYQPEEEVIQTETIEPEILEQPEPEVAQESKRLTRKRKRREKEWKRNVNKKLREQGLEYENVKKEKKRARNLLKICNDKCKYLCKKKISENERLAVHAEFWKLSNDSKLHFFSKNTERISVKRRTVKNKNFRRIYSYNYYFHISDERIKVRKKYFLGTLDISQRRISYFYEKKRDTITGNPTELLQGKHRKKVISEEQKQIVRNHIDSIPQVDSHYCRQRSNKNYFESSLNFPKLYDLYTTWCSENSTKPVKKSFYRNVFNYEYNIKFLKPKKDRCDICEEYKLKQNNEMSPEENVKFKKHLMSKEASKIERDKDRKNEVENTAIVCFDMENVFSLPRSNISCFFYSRKLNTYNLTAHCNLNKRAYCAIWSEGLHGRKANDIASALIRILSNIITDLPNVNKLILWSDSCVPQNKNSVMAMALKIFMKENPQILEIIQKFSEAGHSLIQEVDNIHSQIEKRLAGLEVYSPLGLVRLLITVNKKKPFKIIQMRNENFKEYQKTAEHFNFRTIPFTQVKQLKYIGTEQMIVFFKLDHNETIFNYWENISFIAGKRNQQNILRTEFPSVKNSPDTKKCLLSKEKVLDLIKLFKFMPQSDKEYFNTLLFEYKDSKNLEKLKRQAK